MTDKPIVFSRHARHVVDERKLAEEWIAEAIVSPAFTEPDPTQLEQSELSAGSEPLAIACSRVIYCDAGTEYRIITVFFDRQASRRSPMRVRTDEAADALYIRLEESAIVESEEVSPGVILDFDEGGRVVGIEILNVRERLPGADLKRVEVEVA